MELHSNVHQSRLKISSKMLDEFPDQCANCSIDLEKSPTKSSKILYKKENNRKKMEEVTNFEAFSVIYGMSSKQLKHQMIIYFTEIMSKFDLNVQREFEQEFVNFILCEQCARLYEKMYCVHKSFNHLTNSNSLISKTLRNGFLSPESENDEDCDVIIKSEIEEDEIIDPLSPTGSSEQNMMDFSNLYDIGSSSDHEMKYDPLDVSNLQDNSTEEPEESAQVYVRVTRSSTSGRVPRKIWSHVNGEEETNNSEKDGDSDDFSAQSNTSDYSNEKFQMASQERRSLRKRVGRNSGPTKAITNPLANVINSKFNCKQCGLSFLTSYQKKRHQEEVHLAEVEELPCTIEGPPFDCPKCDKQYRALRNVRHHCLRAHRLRIPWKDNVKRKPRIPKLCAVQTEKLFELHEKSNTETQPLDKTQPNDIPEFCIGTERQKGSKRLTFRCPKCPKTFFSYTSKWRHMSQGHNENKNSQKHVETTTTDEPRDKKHRCPKCPNLTFQFYTAKRRHMLMAHCKVEPCTKKIEMGPEGSFLCPECSQPFKNTVDVRAHLLYMHKLQVPVRQLTLAPYLRNPTDKKCYECKSVFTDMAELKNHYDSEHSLRFLCNMCYQCFSEDAQLQDHMVSIHEEANQNRKKNKTNDEIEGKKGNFLCKFCNQTFSTECGRRKHIVFSHIAGVTVLNVDVKGPPYQCPKCDKQFSIYHNLREHTILMHKVKLPMKQVESSPDILLCPKCGKIFKKKGDLKAHQISHDSALKFICEICGKGYKRNTDCRKHMNTHAQLEHGIRPQCEFCGKDFQHSLSLNQHKYRLHNVKTTCKHCSKGFKNKSALQKHLMKKHAGKQANEAT